MPTGPYNSYFNKRFGLQEDFLADTPSIEEYYRSRLDTTDSPLTPEGAGKALGIMGPQFEQPSIYNAKRTSMTGEQVAGLAGQGLGAAVDIYSGLAEPKIEDVARLSAVGGDIRFAPEETLDKEAYLASVGQAGAGKGGKIGGGVGAAVGVGATAITGGAAAPLIPAFQKAGEFVGGLVGGKSAEREAEKEYGEYLKSVESKKRRHAAFRKQQEESAARLQDIYGRGSIYSAGYQSFA